MKSDTYFYSQKWYDILEIEKKILGNERTYRINAILEEDRKIAEKPILIVFTGERHTMNVNLG